MTPGFLSPGPGGQDAIGLVLPTDSEGESVPAGEPLQLLGAALPRS